MDYTTIASIIRENGNGTHAFDKAADAACVAAKEHPEKAAGFFLLGWEAREFVNVFERMPVSKGSATAAQNRLATNAEALEAAGDDAEKLLQVLNEMARTFCVDE